jgi:hypothetical protein
VSPLKEVVVSTPRQVLKEIIKGEGILAIIVTYLEINMVTYKVYAIY